MAFLLPVATWLGANWAGVTAVASLGVGAYGLSKGAEATRKQASMEDQASQFEAAQLETRSKETVAAGSYQADRVRKKLAAVLSAERAAAAAGGGDSTDQSVREIAKESIREASLDQILTMSSAEADARKDLIQAAQTRKQGKATSEVLRSKARGDIARGASSLLGSATAFDWRKEFGGSPGVT